MFLGCAIGQQTQPASHAGTLSTVAVVGCQLLCACLCIAVDHLRLRRSPVDAVGNCEALKRLLRVAFPYLRNMQQSGFRWPRSRAVAGFLLAEPCNKWGLFFCGLLRVCCVFFGCCCRCVARCCPAYLQQCQGFKAGLLRGCCALCCAVYGGLLRVARVRFCNMQHRVIRHH